MVFNLNTWFYFYFKIAEMAYQVDPRLSNLAKGKTLKEKKQFLDLITCAIIIILFVIIGMIIYQGISKEVYEFLGLFFGFLFMTLGFAFLVSGILTNMRLSKYFNEFYNENKCSLIGATLGLSLPLLLRGFLDWLRHYNDGFSKWLVMHIMFYDTGFFLINDIIPLGF